MNIIILQIGWISPSDEKFSSWVHRNNYRMLTSSPHLENSLKNIRPEISGGGQKNIYNLRELKNQPQETIFTSPWHKFKNIENQTWGWGRGWGVRQTKAIKFEELQMKSLLPV